MTPTPPSPTVATTGSRRGSPRVATTPVTAWWAIALTGVILYVSCFALALRRGDYNLWGTMLIGPALVLVSVPLLRRAVRAETDRRIGTFLVVAFFVKLAMAFVNHAVAFGLYGGVADARGYHDSGVAYSVAFRSGIFQLAEEGELGRRFINTLTGGVYTVIGPSKLGGYLVFSWFAFWGLYLFYRAFVVAVPEGNRRRYASLLFFLPSTLFWSSSIGKEAWMMLSLGLFSLGAARLLARRPGGLVVLSLGLAASSRCRPHLSLLILIGLVVGYLFRRSSNLHRLGPLATLGSLAVLVAVGSFAAGQFTRHFELTSLGTDSFQEVFDAAERGTEGGGSSFSIEGLPRPLAAISVLFRPFPGEAHNAAALVASVEGAAMLVLVVRGRRRLLTAVRRLRSNVYVLYCATVTALFLVGFSAFQNFGILARERIQVIPFVLVLLALPPARRVGRLDRYGPPPLVVPPPDLRAGTVGAVGRRGAPAAQ